MNHLLFEKLHSYKFPYFFKWKFDTSYSKNTYYFLIRNSKDIDYLINDIRIGCDFKYFKTDYINNSQRNLLYYDNIDGDFDRVEEDIFYFNQNFCLTEIYHERSYNVATKIDKEGERIDYIFFDKKIDDLYYFRADKSIYYNKNLEELQKDYFINHFLTANLNLTRVQLNEEFFYGVSDSSGNVLVKPIFNSYIKDKGKVLLYSNPYFFFNGSKYVLYDPKVHINYGLQKKPECCFSFEYDSHNFELIEKRKYNGNEMIYLTDDFGKWFNLYYSLLDFFEPYDKKLKTLDFKNLEILKRILDERNMLDISDVSLKQIIETVNR